MNDLIVAKLNSANHLLAEAKTIQDTAVVVDIAHAAEIYAKRRQLGEEAIGHAHSIKVYALQKLGQMLAATPRATGDLRRGSILEPRENPAPTLAELGIDKKMSSLAQKIAALPMEKVVTLAAHVETINQAHVGYNSGENEWYTPEIIIAAVRHVMSTIDLDPASTAKANAVVKAKQFFSTDDDGLSKPWSGSVFLNPPYAQPLISQFIDKLIGSEVTQATVLVNNATETEWGQKLLLWCDAVCFLSGRVRFWSPNKAFATPLQGQMICYRGSRFKLFATYFEEQEIGLAFCK